MTFRLKHEWPEASRLISAELATCKHCGTLRVIDAGKPTRYLQPLGVQKGRPDEEEPPCIEPPPRPARRAPRVQLLSQLGPTERAREIERASRRDPGDPLDRPPENE